MTVLVGQGTNPPHPPVGRRGDGCVAAVPNPSVASTLKTVAAPGIWGPKVLRRLNPAGPLLRLVRGVLARTVAYPLRSGVLVFASGWVFTGLGLLAVAVAATSAVVVAWGAGKGILRRSLRDPLELNPLVKSLRLRRRVRRLWARAMHDAGLEKATRGEQPAYPRHKRIRLTATGVQTRVNVGAISGTADGFRAKRGNLQSKFRAVGSRVQETSPGWVQLDLRHTDPLTRKITVDDLPSPVRRGYIVVGIDEDGAPVEKEFRLPSLLVGAQGSGKSTEIWTTLHGLIRAGIQFRLRVFDPKGGQEFTDLRDVAYVYERNPLRWPQFLGSALGGLLSRQDELSTAGVRNLRSYSLRNPLDLMVIDELVTVSAFKSMDVAVNTPDGRQTLKADQAHMLYLSQGRSAGYSELACTQLGQKAVVGPQIMDLYGYRTCLRVGSDELVGVVLQRPGAAAQYPAHLLAPDESSAGMGYVDLAGRGVVKYRAALLSEAQRRWTIRRIGEMNAAQRAARGGQETA